VKVLKWTISLALLTAAIVIVGYNYNFSDVLGDLRKLSIASAAVIFATLMANVLAATLRFKVVSADIGHLVSFRRAGAAVSSGNLAGAMFFQIAGQLMARGVVMARAGIPFASVVVVTAYERIVAAIVSGVLALAGAYFIFGNVYLDQNAGGGDLIKIMVGLIAATAAGALLGYGRMAVSKISPLIKKNFVRQCLRLIGLTFVVQLPVMGAYVVTAHILSPQTSISSLVAASAVVMFAASVPVSLGGWGVREMSAVVALGTIGVEARDAVLAAVIVGAGSMIATGALAAISLPGLIDERQGTDRARGSAPINYAKALDWIVPIAVSTVVFFQIYVPIGSGTLLNVNLADPMAILGASLFIVNLVHAGKLPQWRFSYINGAIIVSTLVLTTSLLIGADRFGWTNWAWVNRYCGWFVLLAYAASGALITKAGGRFGLLTLTLTFVGVGASIAALEICLVMLKLAGLQFSLPVISSGVEGFSLNHNFFAFQILMAISATLVAASGLLRTILLALMMAALYFTGSRSGWVTLPFVLGAGVVMQAIYGREICKAVVCAIAIVFAVMVPAALLGQPLGFVRMVVTEANTNERLFSIIGGLQLFLSHPIFGAGLGAFRDQLIMKFGGGQPLLIHSTYVWLLAELGIAGLAAFAVPALAILWTETRRPHPDLAGSLIVLAFAGFAVMSLPADMMYQRTFWLLIGAALACKTQ
jgi:uncharacterized membrane protein YbhN (UPF0104 family)